MQLDATRLAVAWYSDAVRTVTQPGVLAGDLPLDFTFTIRGAPPDDALWDNSLNGGHGHSARGLLIAYRDGNDNGCFDPLSPDGTSADTIVGASAPDPSLPPPERSFYVVYLDGTLGYNDVDAALALPQGYSLIETRYDYGTHPVPPETPVTVPVTMTDAIAVYGCPERRMTGCGIDGYGGKYLARGMVSSSGSESWIGLRVDDASGEIFATIALDGNVVPWEGTDVYYSTSAGPLTGAHALTLDVPGYATETLDFTMPAIPELIAPAGARMLRQGNPVLISWTSAGGAAYYDITVRAPGRWLFHDVATDLSLTTPAIDYEGDASLTVTAVAPLAIGTSGSYVTPTAEDSVTVTFVP